ncbi:hypothetical protein JOC86_000648 [Bacillus pakistanensis]|uniref:DUF1033 family protein n=1 Tax=Rossellomorea pakistanensis TaxID=992288 RepID=A0ABS2N972_9BACI|nr:hypothetical protein [Bacillus pakistanensis]
MGKWKIIQTKGESEPWWFFDDWRKDITAIFEYESKIDTIDQYVKKIGELKKAFPYLKQKNYHTVAFWDPNERVFCEGCDDDLQIYHGLIFMYNDNLVDLKNEVSIRKVLQ